MCTDVVMDNSNSEEQEWPVQHIQCLARQRKQKQILRESTVKRQMIREVIGTERCSTLSSVHVDIYVLHCVHEAWSTAQSAYS